MAARLVQLLLDAGDVGCGLRRGPGELLDLGRDDDESTARVAKVRGFDRGVDRQEARLARDAAQLIEKRTDLARTGLHRVGERGGRLDGRCEIGQRRQHRVDPAVVVRRRLRERAGQRAQALRGLRDVRRTLIDLGDRRRGAFHDGALLGGVRDDVVQLIGVERSDLRGGLDDRAKIEHLGPQAVDVAPQHARRGKCAFVDARERPGEIAARLQLAQPRSAALGVAGALSKCQFPHHYLRYRPRTGGNKASIGKHGCPKLAR